MHYLSKPESLLQSLSESGRSETQRLYLGLDLGTSCGYAYALVERGRNWFDKPPVVGVGLLDLSAGPFDSGALRFLRLRQVLHIIKPDIVGFEDVKYTPAETITKFNVGAIMARAATSCEFFGGMKSVLSTYCEEFDVPCQGFPIGTIKKRATGKGNANKEDMIKAANAARGFDLVVDGYATVGSDNVADAFWVLTLLGEQFPD